MWEYQAREFFPADSNMTYTQMLNEQGAEGWELVSREGRVFIFKRPKECDACHNNAISHYCPTKEQPFAKRTDEKENWVEKFDSGSPVEQPKSVSSREDPKECLCGLDSNDSGLRYDIVCPKHDA